MDLPSHLFVFAHTRLDWNRKMWNYSGALPISLGLCFQGEQAIGGTKSVAPRWGRQPPAFHWGSTEAWALLVVLSPCPKSSIQPPFDEIQGFLGALRLHSPHSPALSWQNQQRAQPWPACQEPHSTAAEPHWCCGFFLRSLQTSRS